LTEKQRKQLLELRTEYHIIAAKHGSTAAAYKESRGNLSKSDDVRVSYFAVLEQLLAAEERVVDELHTMLPNLSLDDVLRTKNAVLGFTIDPSLMGGVPVALLVPKPQRRGTWYMADCVLFTY